MNEQGRWGDHGVTEQQIMLEDAIQCPSTVGGIATQPLQRVGYLKKLRMYLDAELSQTAATGIAVKSPYGQFAGLIRRVRIEAAGKQPLFACSGLGATIYNEIQNRDGGVLAYPNFIAAMGLVEATPLSIYTVGAAGAKTLYCKYPIEYAFSVPVEIRGIAHELGLWLLQDRSIDLSIEVEWNKGFSVAADYNTPYSADATLAGTIVVANSHLRIERELYTVPADPKARPNEEWVHQVIEYEEAIAGKKFRFNFPSAGLVLRAAVMVLDSSDDPVEYTDIAAMSVIYGSNTTPIRRAGWAMVQEGLQDYGRYFPKGVVVLDFYKWGKETLKLAKNSEVLANFRLEGEFTATTTGTVKIILDTLQRVIRQ